MSLIEDLSRNGIEDCFYSPEAQKSNSYSVKLFTSALKAFQCNNRIVMAQKKHSDYFYVVELLDDWNVDVPSGKYPRNVESPRVSPPGFGNDSMMMVMPPSCNTE
ncbi:uncharacterized protein TNCV_402751 [Trichonephila clavipes]|nr:uncharacterized protein TNCV_402751 [Trichonephila clavipes]